MHNRNEYTPLLRTFESSSQRRNIFRRIPYEVTVTGIILGAFLLVVTLLIVLENTKSTPGEQIEETKKILASPLKAAINPLQAAEFFKKEVTHKYIHKNTNIHKNTKKYDEKDYVTSTRRSIDDDSTFTVDDSWKEIVKLKKQSIKEKLDYIKNWLKDWKNNFLEDNVQGSPEKQSIDEYLTGLLDKYEKQLSEEDENELNDLLDKLLELPKSFNNQKELLLGFPFKYNKKNDDGTSQKKKEGYKPKVLHTHRIVEDTSETITLAETELLGSPLKFNKKSYDFKWQDKKEKMKISKKEFFNNKWSDVDKDLQTLSLNDAPLKYNKNNVDILWRDKLAKLKISSNYFNNYTLDKYEKGFKKLSLKDTVEDDDSTEMNRVSELKLLASPFKYNKKSFDNMWQEKKEKYRDSKDAYNNYKWNNVDKGFKKIPLNGLAAPPSGCPYKNKDQPLEAELQAQIDCQLILEDVRRSYGKCIDLSFLPKECKPAWRKKCFSTYKYRKIDGTCNNQIHPTWGTSGTPFVRMLAPEYGDGVSSLRTSNNGNKLPNARFLSQKLYSKQMKPDIDVSMLFIFFGLFVDHDMIETAIETDSIACCDMDPSNRPRECLQIDIPPDDPFYGPKNVKCLNLVRSIPVQGNCIGRREQLNKATAFLDGSAIYGSTIGISKSLRSFSKGQLKTQNINNRPFMVYANNTGFGCGTPSEPLKCFASGDSRANMLVDLIAMHTLWFREHNRVAEELHNINPQWTDEMLYQEARRIVSGELQHIAYKEFLPLLLGEDAMEHFQLNVGRGQDYDETLDPSIFNVFGSAAFRFGHSLVQDELKLNESVKIPLHQTFFNAQLLHHNALDLLLKGAAGQKVHSADSYVSNEVREHLFQKSDKDFGHDLAAVGIQRGRDHGLPGYKKWRSVCGLSDVETWEDLNYIMQPERAAKLKEVYQSLDDIDLIPGALAENHVEGSLLGPTHVCIIGRQFKKTRKGDRYWFENQGDIGSFTKDQLEEIYHSNMARIVCDNSDYISQMQKYTFTIPSAENPEVDCQSIPKVDLARWKSSFV